MSDTSVKKVEAGHSPKGPEGQKYLASGKLVSMRLWEDESAGEPKPETSRDYETVGFVLKGRARLLLEGQTIELGEGDCWVVPQHARHRYEILETFSAIEATAPPARVHARDEQDGGG